MTVGVHLSADRLPDPPAHLLDPAVCRPPVMEHHEKTRLLTAAYHAKRRWPGPVGEFLYDSLDEAQSWGYRLSNDSRLMRLADAILTPELPR